MNTNRRGLLLSGRRSCQAAALTLGALALGGVCAPAALAMQGTTDAAVPATPADASAPRILTGSPVLGLGSPDDRVQFGNGKQQEAQLAIAPDGTNTPQGADIDLSGAVLRFTYTSALGNDLQGEAEDGVSYPSETCTTDAAGDCDFTEDGTIEIPVQNGGVALFPQATFTIEQLSAPASGQLLLPEGDDAIVYGETGGDLSAIPVPDDDPALSAYEEGVDQVEEATVTDSPLNAAPVVDDGVDDETSSVTFQDPGAYRTIAVTTSTPAGAPVAGATYTLCTVPDAPCTDPAQLVSATTDAQGRLVFPGLYLPGTYTITQTTTASGLQFSGTPVSFTVTAAQSVADTQAALVLPVVNGAPAAPAPTGPTLTPVVTPVATAGPQLARTGTDTVPMALAGAGLLAVGAGAVAAGRRRSRAN
ncbi:hypothetical protein ASG36_11980 [Geodermatophilus sp. Leaf369]|uniref:SpaA isopeptide-forming pilin-related protein n=1 Tax=Geodermatophilus sp. Leaf369 TaxID=1736354 RepID=UPI0006F28540|nr:SpaA isopeptide-forming pilin-related protein [Geodermatophilus sp. Leaf369]KQS58727.1 hypothetical protein ASG36_11980 [Geodermatophilus sp. Leaf369]